MSFQRIEINGGSVRGNLPWKLEIPPGRKGYTNAQIDDYHGLKRAQYRWRPGTRLSIRARFSGESEQLRGTAGFGFWNAPFGDPSIPVPAFPKAAWFFFASKPTDLPFSTKTAGRGWFAATVSATNLRGLSLLPLAPGILLLNQSSRLRDRIWIRIGRYLGLSYQPIPYSMTDWHLYELNWHTESCEFWIDGQVILNSQFSPAGPMGFVCWIDNQFLVARPTGKLRSGTLTLESNQWLAVDEMTIERIPGLDVNRED